MASPHEYVTKRSGIVMKNLADFLPTGLIIDYDGRLRRYVVYEGRFVVYE